MFPFGPVPPAFWISTSTQVYIVKAAFATDLLVDHYLFRVVSRCVKSYSVRIIGTHFSVVPGWHVASF